MKHSKNKTEKDFSSKLPEYLELVSKVELVSKDTNSSPRS